MPELEPIRTAASAASRRSNPGSLATATSPANRQLTHVQSYHSFHIDDSSVYQDHLHDLGPLEDELAADEEAEANGNAPAGSIDGDDQAQAEKQGATGPDLEKAISHKSLGRRVTTRSGQENDPNMIKWKGPDDPANPKNWPKAQKWQATIVASMFTLMSPVSSSMVAPATSSILRELGVTNGILGQMIISAFVLAYAFGPLIFAPLSEIYGRSIVLQLSNLFFLVFNTACGAATSPGMLIAFRFLAGLGGSAPLATGGGLLSDTWRPAERGAAVAIYSALPLLGPSVAPICGGYIAERLGEGGWRWIFYSVSIADALVQLVGLFLLKETYPPTLLQKQLKAERKRTGNMDLYTEYDDRKHTPRQLLAISLMRPFRLLFTQPIVQFLAVYQAFLFGTMYLLLSTFSQLFTTVYGEDIGTSGLNYLSLGLGFLIGAQVSARTMDMAFRYLCKRNGGKAIPEYRALPMIPGTVLTPIGLFLYGWSAQYHTHWIVPNIGALIFGIGTVNCSNGIQSYIVDTYTLYSASAISAVTFMRSLAGFGFPLFAPAMYKALSYGWGNSVLGFAGVVIGIPAPIVLWYYGPALRAMSPFATGK